MWSFYRVKTLASDFLELPSPQKWETIVLGIDNNNACSVTSEVNIPNNLPYSESNTVHLCILSCYQSKRKSLSNCYYLIIISSMWLVSFNTWCTLCRSNIHACSHNILYDNWQSKLKLMLFFATKLTHKMVILTIYFLQCMYMNLYL